jgi:hypothetical protein
MWVCHEAQCCNSLKAILLSSAEVFCERSRNKVSGEGKMLCVWTGKWARCFQLTRNSSHSCFLNSACTNDYKEPGSAVGIATGYGLEDGPVVESEFRWGQEFSLLHVVHTGSGAHLASCTVGTGGSSSGGKAEHSPQTTAEVKKMWIYTSIPQYAFMA